MNTQFVGIIGSGLMGRDPFDRRSWSTSSYFFFTALQRQGALSRAFAVEVPRLNRFGFIARNFRRDREAWRMSFYNDTGYRDALTAEISKKLNRDDFLGQSFLQIGAMYDVPQLIRGRYSCFSYHDGNLAMSLRSPYAPIGLDQRSTDRALSYERHVYLGMNKVFAMSDYLRRSFIEDFGVPEERVSSVGAGINMNAIPDPQHGKCYDIPNLLFIGVDFARKGGWELLKAFRAVREKVANATLHIVGPRELKIPTALEGGVVVHGYLNKTNPEDQKRLMRLFERCCLFVMPSLYEPFGIAPLEAMAHQLPCLVTDAWALKEIVTRGKTGDGKTDEPH